jgi:hypothetical protein
MYHNKTKQSMKISFYIHTMVFTLVNLMLVYINLYVTPVMSDEICQSLTPMKEQLLCYNTDGERISRFIWFIYPLFGWGVGLLGHLIATIFFVQNNTK